MTKHRRKQSSPPRKKPAAAAATTRAATLAAADHFAGNTGPLPVAPPIELPPCPDHLAPAARDEWQRAGAILAARGQLTAGDRALLSLYATAWGRHVEAEQKVTELGAVVKSPSGFPVLNPYLAIAAKAGQEARRLALDLGLSPGRGRRQPAHAAPGASLIDPWPTRILTHLLADTEALSEDPVCQAHGVPWSPAAVAGQAVDETTRTAISRALQDLERGGYLERYRPAGRTTHVKLTPAGLDLARRNAGQAAGAAP